jgi:hypothetical protein
MASDPDGGSESPGYGPCPPSCCKLVDGQNVCFEPVPGCLSPNACYSCERAPTLEGRPVGPGKCSGNDYVPIPNDYNGRGSATTCEMALDTIGCGASGNRTYAICSDGSYSVCSDQPPFDGAVRVLPDGAPIVGEGGDGQE